MQEKGKEGRMRFLAGDDFTDVPRIPESFLAPQNTDKGSDDAVCEHPTPILDVGQRGVARIHIAFAV